MKNKTWLLTELLRPLVFKAEFQRNSETLYTAVQFAGYIGVLTGIRKVSMVYFVTRNDLYLKKVFLQNFNVTECLCNVRE